MHYPRLAAVCAVAALLAGCGGGHGVTSAIPATGDTTPQSLAAAPAVPSTAMAPDPRTIGSLVGRAPSNTEVDMYISLPGRNQAQLQTLLREQSTPGSENYHAYLTPDQFGREFGADPTQYAQTVTALRTAGFTIDDQPVNLKDIVVHAPASTVAAFFGSSMDLRTAEGREFYTLHTQPVVPAVMKGALIVGLDNYHQRSPHFVKPQMAQPMVTIGKDKGWGAKDIESVYNLTPIYSTDNGSGITIIDATEGLASSSDFSAFTKEFGLTSAKLVNVSAGSKSPKDTNGETTLDVEYMAAVAPDVTIDQVTAPGTSDANFDTMYSYIVNKMSSVHLVSTSWGDCEAEYGSSLSTDESLFEQAYAEGQFWLSAAGDDGVDDCGNGTKGVDFPGSSPYVVSVGGTRVTPSSTSGSNYTGWSTEAVWDDTEGCTSVSTCNSKGGGAGGGGVSIDYSKPSFQSGVTPADGMRDVPDISFMADDEDPNGGYFVYFEGSWQNGWGGTSFAAPEWTAFLALTQQHHGGSVTSPLVRLYDLASGSSYGSYFHDVKSGCNTYDGVTGFCAGTAFDQGSGWGSPNGDALWAAY